MMRQHRRVSRCKSVVVHELIVLSAMKRVASTQMMFCFFFFRRFHDFLVYENSIVVPWSVLQTFGVGLLSLQCINVVAVLIERGEKTPTPKISALLRKQPALLRANFVLTKDRKRPYYGHFCGKIHREGSCSKATGGP